MKNSKSEALKKVKEGKKERLVPKSKVECNYCNKTASHTHFK